MAWLSPSNVSDVYSHITPTQGLCDHVQALAEAVIGTQEEPIGNSLKAVMVDIVVRFYSKSQASAVAPAGFQRERIDDYEYEQFAQSGGLGLGLTKAERAALRQAVGDLPLQAVGTTRGDVEMAEPITDVIDWTDPDLA